jgi:hypothetical protein
MQLPCRCMPKACCWKPKSKSQKYDHLCRSCGTWRLTSYLWMYVDMFDTLQKRPGFSCAMLIRTPAKIQGSNANTCAASKNILKLLLKIPHGPFAAGALANRHQNQNSQWPNTCLLAMLGVHLCYWMWLQCLFAFAIIVFTTLSHVCLFDQSLSVYKSCHKIMLYFFLDLHPWELKLKKLQFSETQSRRLFDSCAKMAQLLSVPFFSHD